MGLQPWRILNTIFKLSQSNTDKCLEVFNKSKFGPTAFKLEPPKVKNKGTPEEKKLLPQQSSSPTYFDVSE